MKRIHLLLLAAVSVLCCPASAGSYQYDPSGRLVQIIGPDGSRTMYRYDASGRIIQIERAR